MNRTGTTVDIKAAWVRGGTSKCWIFAAEAVEATPLELDVLLENALGSGDRRQIDGVGGSTSTTSKVAVVSRSADPQADVDYLFGQVGIADRVVEWGSNCGNCATAVGLYAVQEGLVAISGDTTTVRLRNVNTDTILHVGVSTPSGHAPLDGEALVPGVQSGGVPIELTFRGPFGPAEAFPTGRVREVVSAGGAVAEASIVNAGAPAVLIEAETVAMTGTETAEDIAGELRMLTGFRAAGAVLHGLVPPGQPAPNAVPKTGVIGAPRDYLASDGTLVRAQDYDVAVRMLSMHAAHPAIGLTSAVAVAVAAATPGSVIAPYRQTGANTLRIGTLSGVVEVTWTVSDSGHLEGISLHRAARRLATAVLHVPMAAGPRRPATGPRDRDRPAMDLPVSA